MKIQMIIFYVILIVVIIAGTIAYIRYIPTHVLTFTESNKVIVNPARGFYVQINSYEDERIKGIKEEDVEVILVAYDIEDYINTTISDEKLEELRIILNEARANDIQVVFRAAYGFDPNYEDPASIENIETHIKQIAPILNANKDVILSLQAGFIGPWGEWHSSEFLTGDDKEVDFRNQIITTLLDNLEEEIVINLRRPRFIRDAIAAGINSSRLGLHNDALLSTEDDLGTYDDNDFTREDELLWANDNLMKGVNGGEMPFVGEYVEIDNAVKELESLQITYLNKMYNTEVLEGWKNEVYKGQNGYDYIMNHLGYRLSLSQVELPETLKINHRFTITIGLQNTGFAPIDPAYALYFIMKRGDEIIYETKIDGDINSIKGGMEQVFEVDPILSEGVLESSQEEAIVLGVYITNLHSSSSANTEVFGNIRQIELANEEIGYEEGINLFASYSFDETDYRLVNLNQ